MQEYGVLHYILKKWQFKADQLQLIIWEQEGQIWPTLLLSNNTYFVGITVIK